MHIKKLCFINKILKKTLRLDNFLLIVLLIICLFQEIFGHNLKTERDKIKNTLGFKKTVAPRLVHRFYLNRRFYN